MKVYRSMDSFSRLRDAVATTGTFDGVHLGHLSILDRLVKSARALGGESVLITFDPHPRKVLQPETPLKLLSSLDEKIDRLRKTGLDHLIVQEFTLEFSRIRSLDFVRNLLVEHIGVRKLVIGHDHHFGRNREGSFEHLREFAPLYGFDVEEIPALDVDRVAVSSTKIRTALSEGKVDRAASFLGYFYGLDARVVKGDQIGRTLGFPTANLEPLDADKMLPAHGVYAVRVRVSENHWLQAMAHLGPRPALGRVEERFEVHLFDFEGDLYDRILRIEFVEHLRPIVSLSGTQALIDQLHQDQIQAKKALKSDGLPFNF